MRFWGNRSGAVWSEQSLAATGPEVQLALRGGKVWHGEIIGRRKDDALYTAELKGTPLL